MMKVLERGKFQLDQPMPQINGFYVVNSWGFPFKYRIDGNYTVISSVFEELIINWNN